MLNSRWLTEVRHLPHSRNRQMNQNFPDFAQRHDAGAQEQAHESTDVRDQRRLVKRFAIDIFYVVQSREVQLDEQDVLLYVMLSCAVQIGSPN